MIDKILCAIAGLVVAGSLFLVACEPEGSKPPPPPPTDKSQPAPAPAPAPSPNAPKEGEKKTGAVTPAPGNAVLATATEAAKEAMKCGSCPRDGLASKSLVHAGKTVTFCCDGCLTSYKKTNNIQ